jgi:uncharacterized membrane protein
METLLLVCLIAVLVISWFYVRQRFEDLEARVSSLTAQVKLLQTPVPAQPVGQVPDLPRQQPREAPAPLAVKPDLRPIRPPFAPDAAAPPPVSPLASKPALQSIPSQFAPDAPTAPSPAPAPPPRAPLFSPERAAPAPARSSAEWESLIGGNFLNKLGVVILVIGIALALGYSFTRVGPAGRVAISLAASFAMLVAGAVMERRERYRTFARGLLGGGWAALYFTVYAMHAIPAARILDHSISAAALLIAVAAGMIIHSLRYRSQTVTGLAYFIAFVTLTPGISEVTSVAVAALMPLAASLLYIAHRFRWRTFAVLGLVATYATCASRPDTGAALWQTQTIFAVYWLLFEAFDLLCADPWILPLNAVGFLGISLAKWNHAAPDRIWQLPAAVAVAYLAGAILRARSDRWRFSATLAAALGAAAIFLKLDHQWIAFALLVEAELFHLAGVRLRAPYLRHIGVALFAIELGHLTIADVGTLPVYVWTPIAALDALVFYVNRAIRHGQKFYGYAGAAMLALVAGYNAPHDDHGLTWFLIAAVPFAIGWRWRLSDFRFQAYGLAALGLLGMAADSPEPLHSLAIAAALAYACALVALRSSPDRFLTEEPEALRFAGSLAATGLLTSLVWRIVPDSYHGLAWMALALPLLELGMRRLPENLRRQAYVLTALGAVLVFYNNLLSIQNDGPLAPRLIPAGAALAAYAAATRARKEEAGAVLDIASVTGTAFLLPALWALLPPAAVAPAWAAVAVVLVELDVPVLRREGHLVGAAAFARLFFANFDIDQRLLTVVPVILSQYYLWSKTRGHDPKIARLYLYAAAIATAVLLRFQMGHVFTVTGWAVLAVVLLLAGLRWNLEDLRWQSYALAGIAFVRCWSANFYSPEMFGAIAGPVLTGSIVIACLYTAQLLTARGGHPRMFYSLLGTVLLAVLLYYQVSASVLTVAWGAEGVALLVSGFPLRDRVLRLSGLALLLFCILKLFVYDLRYLETLPRIFSFVALGLILVSVSWLYTRFREHVQRYL